MNLLNSLDRVLRTRSQPPASFTITPERILDESEAGEEQFLKPQASYFVIRLKQMHLRDQREYWREYRPFSSVVTAFLHAGERQEIPFVVGPEMLGEAVKLQDGDQVEYLNTRVAGPFPYEGDDLRLFVGLARVKTRDWAVNALGLLETFARAFDPSKLSQYLDVATPLAAGINSVLGMQDVELRLGLLRDYVQPRGRGGLKPNALQRRYEVLLNVPEQKLASSARERFWIKDGRLFFGEDAATAQPYREADFLLYQIQPLAERADYTSFDFHKRYWPETVNMIWEKNEQGAWQKLRLLAANLATCPDIVRPQRNLLLRMYKQQFDEEFKLYNEMFSGENEEVVTRDTERFRAKVATRVGAVTDADMSVAIREGNAAAALARLREQSPEATLRELGL